MEKIVETAASCVAAAALAGCAVYVIEQLLPQGRLRECVRLIGSAVIGIIVLACARDAANILTEIKTGENTAVIMSRQADMGLEKGITIQIHNQAGFGNADVTVRVANGQAEGVIICAKSEDNDDVISFEARKEALVRMLKMLYSVKEENIVIKRDWL